MSKQTKKNFRFIELFAGIGGFRKVLENVPYNGVCVFSSEWDQYCAKTYENWYGESPRLEDIRNINSSEIPDHDILTAGFPCQPFSLAGVSKKKSMNKAHGFDDEKQGNLFWEISRIVKDKRPSILFLENVKNLKSHDKGNTWDTIYRTLSEELNYKVFEKIIDSKMWVPQHRERIFLVALNRDKYSDNVDFKFPNEPTEPNHNGIQTILETNVESKYTLTDGVWNALKRHSKRHSEKGNGFGYSICNLESISRTLSARYHKDGAEILIHQNNRNPRRLTPVEASRLMGFDKTNKEIVVSDVQAYKQFGNSVVVPVIENITKEIVKLL